MGKIPYYYYKSMWSNTFGGKIMTEWEQINNKRSHSHLSYSHSRSIPISLSNLVPIPWESHGRDGNPAFPIPMHICNPEK